MKRLIGLLLTLVLTLTSLFSCIPDFLFDPTLGYFTYTDFTDEEKNILTTFIGEVIPFSPTDDYRFTELYQGKGYKEGIRYYTYGNSIVDYSEYTESLIQSGYKLTGTTKDNSNRLWNHYEKGNIGITTSYYRYNGNDFIDVCVCYIYAQPEATTTLTNKGVKLPDDDDGVYEIDFTRSEHVKNVGDLKDNSLACPSTGSPSVLVIPVEFPDATASSRGYSIENINRVFTGENDYYSLEEYYYLSSYGALDLQITVIDEWFTAPNNSTYYKNLTRDYNGVEIEIGDQELMNEALDYLDDKMDLSQFDSDGNGTIDAVILINTLYVNGENMFNWAFQYRNYYEDESGNLYEYDGVYAYDYIWASYAFIYEKEYTGNRFTYTDRSVCNPKTFIHEFAHIIGANDYYDTSYSSYLGPLRGLDIMDNSIGDHNPFTKINLGWITESRLVVPSNKSITLTLKPFSESGDTIIIANNWSDELGGYQEYFILIYYRSTGLNGSKDKYFNQDGIVLYHVNSTLICEEYLNDTFYSLQNSNTAAGHEGGSGYDLLELVDCGVQRYILGEGGKLSTVFDDNMELLHTTYTVVSLTEDEATITFSRK